MEGVPKINQENNFEKPQIKEGVEFVFEQNLQFAEIGTKEQYSEYLDIVYHGTAHKNKIENFDFEKSNFAQAVFFTKNRNFAENFAFDDSRNGSVQEQLLDIKNPFDFSNKEHIQELRPVIEQLVKEGYKSENTGIVFRNDLPQINVGDQEINSPSLEDFVNYYMWRLENGSWRIIETDRIIDFISKNHDSILVNERGVTNVAVFNPGQIHVLGSKTDFEQFRDFINKN